MKKLIFILILFLIFILGCQTSSYSKACFDNKCVDLEVMETLEEKQKGLMDRSSLSVNQGMLFLYNNEGDRTFWMKNVLFPIDMIWLDKDNKVIHTEESVPPCEEDPCPIYSPGKPAMNVLEVQAGFVLDNNINIGDEVRFI